MKTKLTQRLTAVAAMAFPVAVSLAVTAPAQAQEYTLRAQTHYSSDSINGRNAAQFVEDVETMSGGRLKIEMHFSSAVVKSVETFDAAASGILDMDMTGAAYQGGKDRGFQFLGDLLGAYNTPFQQTAWLKYGGGRELADELYGEYGMHLLCWWWPGPESLTSTSPLSGLDDLKDWKFRSPPGLQTDIFDALGAKPVVIDFTEIFNALNTGIVDGADASSLANNVGFGFYDIAKHATFPGFHSMPADHVAINKAKWEELPADLQAIMEAACAKLTLNSPLDNYVENYTAAEKLAADGVTFYQWSDEDLKKYREVALSIWPQYAEDSEAAKKIIASHIAFMKKIGLVD